MSALVASCLNVSRRFEVPQRRGPGSSVLALDDVSADIIAGRLVVLSGPSGSGKSTLLALLAALDRATAGSIFLQARELGGLDRAARRRIRRSSAVMVLPQPADNLLLTGTGRENLRGVARLRDVGEGTEAVLDEVITLLGLSRFVDGSTGAMSGGEQQRVAVACALIGTPPLVLADEPTGALDANSAATVIEAFRAAVDHGATVVVATHDPHMIAAADDVIRLDHGRRVQ